MSGNNCLGNLTTEVGHRDAIHAAIISVEAAEDIRSGAWCDIRDGKAINSTSMLQTVGVADPFLPNLTIARGQKFYLLLMPNAVSEVRHEWEHPAFPRPVAETALSPNLRKAISMLEDAAQESDMFCCGSEAADFVYDVLGTIKGR